MSLHKYFNQLMNVSTIQKYMYREKYKEYTSLSGQYKLYLRGNIHERTLHDFEIILPEIYRNNLDEICAHIMQHTTEVYNRVVNIFTILQNTTSTRKEFALVVNKYYKDISCYLFCMYSGNPVQLMILGRENFSNTINFTIT